ncbi:MAG: GNAT family N-acetyltransferase [Deltaproteobacteria bacterium]|nr:GNAT family N-acetyltransferase [Deltaproteobacteria bacterium]
MTLKVRRLEREDDRSAFRSGNVDLDRFFVRYAGQNQFRHHIATTYIAIDASGFIAGFATVTASEIAAATLPASKRKRLPRYPVPVLRLARLAVHERAKGRGAGSLLLRSVLVLAQQMAEEIGCAGVLVDAKPEAVAFYERLGFLPLDPVAGQLGDRPEPRPMFLELAELREGTRVRTGQPDASS